MKKVLTWSFYKGKVVINKPSGAHLSLTEDELVQLQDVLNDIELGNTEFKVDDNRNN